MNSFCQIDPVDADGHDTGEGSISLSQFQRDCFEKYRAGGYGGRTSGSLHLSSFVDTMLHLADCAHPRDKEATLLSKEAEEEQLKSATLAPATSKTTPTTPQEFVRELSDRIRRLDPETASAMAEWASNEDAGAPLSYFKEHFLAHRGRIERFAADTKELVRVAEMAGIGDVEKDLDGTNQEIEEQRQWIRLGEQLMGWGVDQQ
ncbi:hypothetical protein K491DRAFT_710472 [Lophiostoma macrostomum CBS 122681]|uniref:Uncharacterized protein n=1 Tax=Lophiostoma macrostomum CBS 122681 TaxID=1314788 RepID=A0A6A6TQI3_9PLEO|nr:hypothetical protein K491DRAFT_710472 [Lophiostoma macrostomum CBS 122681]